MSKINGSRVISGGLVAGLVIAIADFAVNGLLFRAQWSNALKALGKAEVGGPVIGLLVLTDFLVGIYLVWLYAAIRPRFGAGARTAAYAGISTWFLASLLNAIAEAPTQIFPVRLYCVSVGTMLVVVPLAAITGAWFYREDSTS